MRIFSVLPRPVSPLVNPPPGVYQQPRRSPQNARNAAGVHQPTPARKTPWNAHRTPHSVHQPKPYRHSTNRSTNAEPGRLFKITLYSNPDEVAAHRVAPTETHREPERRRGCNWVASQIEPPTAAHRRHRGQQKTPRAEARSVAPYLFIFNRSAKTTNGKIKMQSKIKSFHPLIEL